MRLWEGQPQWNQAEMWTGTPAHTYQLCELNRDHSPSPRLSVLIYRKVEILFSKVVLSTEGNMCAY